MVVLNAAHQQGAHLHLGDGAEMLRLQDGILPAILDEHGAAGQGNGPHGVQYPRQEVVLPFDAPVNIAVAVIIVYAQAEHQAKAIGIPRGVFLPSQEIRQAVPAAFDLEHPRRI